MDRELDDDEVGRMPRRRQRNYEEEMERHEQRMNMVLSLPLAEQQILYHILRTQGSDAYHVALDQAYGRMMMAAWRRLSEQSIHPEVRIARRFAEQVMQTFNSSGQLGQRHQLQHAKNVYDRTLARVNTDRSLSADDVTRFIIHLEHMGPLIQSMQQVVDAYDHPMYMGG